MCARPKFSGSTLEREKKKKKKGDAWREEIIVVADAMFPQHVYCYGARAEPLD